MRGFDSCYPCYMQRSKIKTLTLKHGYLLINGRHFSYRTKRDGTRLRRNNPSQRGNNRSFFAPLKLKMINGRWISAVERKSTRVIKGLRSLLFQDQLKHYLFSRLNKETRRIRKLYRIHSKPGAFLQNSPVASIRSRRSLQEGAHTTKRRAKRYARRSSVFVENFGYKQGLLTSKQVLGTEKGVTDMLTKPQDAAREARSRKLRKRFRRKNAKRNINKKFQKQQQKRAGLVNPLNT